jgi:CheY-like chemotaxis protein
MTEPRPFILVVEDDDDIRTTVVDVFSFEGYRAIGASHGVEALELLHTSEPKPALILLDLMMPLMNGAEFREHQLADPSLAHIPVVILSADANPDARCAELGAVGWLQKPMKLPALLETAQRFAGGG